MARVASAALIVVGIGSGDVKKFGIILAMLLVLLAAGAAAFSNYYQQRVRQQEIALQTRIRSLSDENGKLSAEIQSMKVLIGKDAEQHRIEKYVEQIRGLSFKKRVR